MLTLGSLVRLISDPQQMGALAELLEIGGRAFGKVQFPGGIRRIPVDQLEAVPSAREEPLDFLRAGKLSDPAKLRQLLTHVRLTGRLADIIYSMESSITEFHAHQFKPVLRMLSSPTDGLLIADEVGLGKTIEAGLIWTELRARFRYGRLLVVCPKVLCAKWQAELSKRFGLDARILGAADLLQLLSDNEEVRREYVSICSMQSIQPPRGWDDETSNTYARASSKFARLLESRTVEEPIFDLVVVDEAHHLRNPETQRHRLAALLRPAAHHRLFLSATPIHLRSRDLFSLLSLLDPETFRRQEDFDDVLEANRPLVVARELALGNKPLSDVIQKLKTAASHPLLVDSQQVSGLISELSGLPDELTLAERARIASRIEQVNLLSNVVSRTRRRDVQELRVVRKVFAHSAEMNSTEQKIYDAISDEVRNYALTMDTNATFLLATPQRLLASSIPAAVGHWKRKAIDYGAEDEDDVEADHEVLRPITERLARICVGLPEVSELELHDSKFDRLLGILRNFFASNPGQKIIIFSTFIPTIEYLRRRLAAGGIECAVIHGHVDDRDAVLARFAEESGQKILLSSEVGSEGLDLQFCRALVNYDLPWNPMRVEQRIGRIDRMGQEAETVSVINLLYAGSIDQRIYERLYERLDICAQALGEFEAVLGEEIGRLTADLLSGRLSKEQENRRIEQTSRAIETKKKMVEDLENEASSLIAHGDEILQRIHAARSMNRWIGPNDLARYLGDSLSLFFPGCTMRELEQDDLFEISLSPECRSAYGDWLNANRILRSGRLGRDFGPIVCKLGRPLQPQQKRSIEVVSQTHPLVRYLAERIGDSEASKLRPAVAARIRVEDSEQNIRPGQYLVMAALWRFGGTVEAERLTFAGLDINRKKLISSDAAEVIAIRAATKSEAWHSVEAELDVAAIAADCEAMLIPQISERFWEEKQSREAEQADRMAIQLRTLERRFSEERVRLIEIIERQRRSLARPSVLAANEGRLRHLEERTASRRRQIEANLKTSAQDESVMVAVVDVRP